MIENVVLMYILVMLCSNFNQRIILIKLDYVDIEYYRNIFYFSVIQMLPISFFKWSIGKWLKLLSRSSLVV